MKDSGIEWTTHTFNPFIGCTKVSAGCANCYAERDNKRYRWVEAWGKGSPRKRTSENYWKQPFLWDKKCAELGIRERVFPSLCDPFDDEVPIQWLCDFLELILKTPHLDWLLCTKRPQNIMKRVFGILNPRGEATPSVDLYHWLDHWEHRRSNPENIWLGVTCENQQMADERIPILLNIPAKVRFLSCEPLLGNVDLSKWIYCGPLAEMGVPPLPDTLREPTIDWVIGGCESGSQARPMKEDWTRSLRDQCTEAGVPFFLKQMVIDGQLVKMPLLDGKVWDEVPQSAQETQPRDP